MPPYAMPDAIMAWYKVHPDAAKGVDLVKLKAGLEARLAEQIKNGAVRWPTPEESQQYESRHPKS